MASVSSIRAALKTNVETVTGLRCVDYVPPQIHPPMAVVSFEGFPEPRRAMGKGLTEMQFAVRVFVAYGAGGDSAEDAMDSYVATSGATSVWAAIESDRTLGAVVSDSIVTGMSGYTLNPDAPNGPLLSCEWQVAVFANAS